MGNAAITGAQPDGRAAKPVPRQLQWHPGHILLALLSLGAAQHIPSVLTCSASQAMCFTSRPPAVGLPEPSVALSSARTWGSSAVMLACRALNHAWAVAVSRQRSTSVFRLSGECSSISLRGTGWDISTRPGEPLPVPSTANWLHCFGVSTEHFRLPGLLALILRQKGRRGPGREHGIALALAKPSGLSFHSSAGEAGGHGLSEGTPPAVPRASVGCRVPHTGTGGQTQPCPGGLWGAGSPPPAPTCSPCSHLFSRSGMLRFRAAKHILRGITLRSRGPWCWGDPESSLPLRLGDCGAAPSHGRSDTSDGFLM